MLEGTSELLVTNYPTHCSSSSVRQRLRQLSDNCGGRVVHINGHAAKIRFPNVESAHRWEHFF